MIRLAIRRLAYDSLMPKQGLRDRGTFRGTKRTGSTQPPAAKISGFVGPREIGTSALIFLVTLAAYLPALHGGFLWDDDGHVTRPDLQSLHGLWRIWFDLGATQQYYPVLHSAFWIEHRLWGGAVLGYHLTSVALHAVSACLVVMIVRRLALPGAWLAGFVFALHPVCVEAVAWIAEQKSTLSGVFYLGAAFLYLQFDQERRRQLYLWATALFVLAVLSKTVTATLPAALLVVFWWRRGRLEWSRDVRPLFPWFTLSVAAGLLTAWVEKTFIGAEGEEYVLTFAQRFLLAGRAIWFYLAKLLWPAGLIFTYPRWQIDAGIWWQWLFPIAVLALLIGLWLLARRHLRGPLAGFLIFAGTLFPVLGFLNVYPFRFSYVADHFQYLAGLGIIIPAASFLMPATARLLPGKIGPAAALGALLLVLGLLTYNQSGVYRDSETLYRHILARNSASWMAHNNLGSILQQQPGHLQDAISEYEAALRLKPDYVEAHYSLGNALFQIPGRLPEAIAHYEAAVRLKPDYEEARNNLGSALLQVPGRLPDAVAQFQAAVRTKPDYADAHNNLANALAQMPGHLPDAIAEYEAALRINPNDADVHFNLGTALLRIGRAPEAIAQYETALRLRPDFEAARQMLNRLRPAQQ